MGYLYVFLTLLFGHFSTYEGDGRKYPQNTTGLLMVAFMDDKL